MVLSLVLSIYLLVENKSLFKLLHPFNISEKFGRSVVRFRPIELLRNHAETIMSPKWPDGF